MGDRGQVELVMSEGSIFLYTHWGAEGLPWVVAKALDRGRSRWDDDEYLNRIIFSQMIKDEVMEETGYGISLGERGDTWRLVRVDYNDSTITVVDNGHSGPELTFDEFVSIHGN